VGSLELIESPCANERLRAAGDFLDSIAPGDEVLVVGATRGAVDDLVRARSAAAQATFGVQRFTLTQLAARIAAPALALRGLAVCTRLGAEAVAARATFTALGRDAIPFFAPVARCPGFARSLAATIAELREARVPRAAFGAHRGAPTEIAVLLELYETCMAEARLADRAALFGAAIAAIEAAAPDPLVTLPCLLIDVPITTRLERDTVAALCGRAARTRAVVPSGDGRTRAALAPLAAVAARFRPRERASLDRLKHYLFNEADEPPATDADDTVQIFSAPGEGREAVEIARRILAEARAGTRFDEIAVFLRSPLTFTPLLETAFRRAGIPAYFARGTRRPNPSGRAFLALLGCACDGLSATRFAEYLAFGQVPTASAATAAEEWTGADDDVLAAARDPAPVGAADDAPPAADAHGGPIAPWKWEEMLVDAAVIGGGVERWRRRLDGLARELDLRREELAGDDPAAPQVAAIERVRQQLVALGDFALPIIGTLAAWPAAAHWSEWFAVLRALAPRVLRTPEPVERVLAELAPLAPIGPVTLDEVRDVLAGRLAYVTDEPPAHRYGRVCVSTMDDARGHSFAVVFVPGLAERMLPQHPHEDPLLLDCLRRELSRDLATQDDRIAGERLLLRLAVGAARDRVYLSYPRIDAVQGRPRVTSFYGLDVARATRGGIPAVERFERDAALAARARLAWPAPPDPAAAIDAAEHDLAVLAPLLHAPADARAKGAAHYLVRLNPHLARALRTRFWRWERPSWSARDGMVQPEPGTLALLAAHRLTARPYAPSALERFATCPYQFFLRSVQRLHPRRVAAPLEQLDPLTRGRLFHRVQAETLRALADAGALPLAAPSWPDAQRVLIETLARVAAAAADAVAPPIARVWDDGIAALRADLVQWLHTLIDSAAAWHPQWFELSFGLPRDEDHDPRSPRAPVTVFGGMQLRGSIDLVERAAEGSALRVTDHKTGVNRMPPGAIVAGGEVLQPVLYGVAAEAALGAPVAAARLFFCTARGGFAAHEIRLDERARRAGQQVLDTIDRAIAQGCFPAAPREDACARCDFHLVCGPHEAERAARKHPGTLADLAALRQMP
jgi:ATP-dependent helicase/nuclease subunit B